MIRSLTLAAAIASLFAVTAVAQDKSMDAPEAAAPLAENAAPPAAGTAPASTAMRLTAEEAKNWVGKPVYSSDDKKLGGVAAVARETDDAVTEMHIDIGGFLGIGETRVKLTPSQFKLQGARIVLDLPAADAKNLPKVE